MSDEPTIELWNVHFDSDEFSYTSLYKAKAIQSIRSFADLQIAESFQNKEDVIDQIVAGVEKQLENKQTDGVLMVMIGDARVHIKRTTLDHVNPIVKTLLAAHSQVDEETQKMIEEIFEPSRV